MAVTRRKYPTLRHRHFRGRRAAVYSCAGAAREERRHVIEGRATQNVWSWSASEHRRGLGG